MRIPARRFVLSSMAIALGVVTVACGGDGTTSDETASDTTLTVLAASSLTEAFPEIGDAFADENDGIGVQFSFAGSQELVAQADSGAPADVLALAGTGSLEVLELAASDAKIFAKNRLTIIVPTGNPAGVNDIEDLADPEVKVALAGPEVPAGAYALEAFENAGIAVKPVSEESEVKAVVTRVAVGGADAGVVYVTDAAASDAEIEEVPIADDINVIASYPAVALTASENAEAADQFVEYLMSEEAQQILQGYGFESP